jgi:hypothetical protein
MTIKIRALHRYTKPGGPDGCRLVTSNGRSDSITDDWEVYKEYNVPAEFREI